MANSSAPVAKLQPGDTIGLCAPAGPVPHEELAAGIAMLQARGYRTIVAEGVSGSVAPFPYLANDDEVRFSGLQALLNNPEVKLVLCVRGGYGTQRLYPWLPDLTTRHYQKILCGYSDITGLHTALRCNVSRIHGPNLSTLLAMDTSSSDWFWSLLEYPTSPIQLPATTETIDVLVPGKTVGTLEGGNLCLLAHSCGTRFQPQFSGCIVLLEDVGEPLYRIDRFLTQLLNSGAFHGVAGIVAGTVSPSAGSTESCEPQQLRQLWMDRLAPLGVPVVSGCRFGHISNPLALPLGLPAVLDTQTRCITLLASITTE